MAGSPGIDDGATSVSEDQRGFERPSDGDEDGKATPDVGAFERDPATDDFPFSFVTQEHVANGGFEASTQGFSGSYGTSVSASASYAHGGSQSLRVSQRTLGTWQGAVYNLLDHIAPGDQVRVSAWVRIQGDPSEPVFLTRRSLCAGDTEERYQTVAAATATNTAWTELSGTLFAPSCELSEIITYVEGPRTGVDLYVDDVSAVHEAWMVEPNEEALSGSFVTTTDWGDGYCVELVIDNPTSEATSTWSAEFDLNGTSIFSIWNLNASGSSGQVSLTPTEEWNSEIPAGGTSHSLGFCATRPSTGNVLPTAPVVTASF